jgi:predicted nucleic acid-binding protein
MELSDGSYIFDTTVFIDVMRGVPVGRHIYFQARFRPDIQVFYSVITEAEVWSGLKSQLRSEREAELIMKPFKRLFINSTIARRAGELYALLMLNHKNVSLPSIADCIIASTAEYHAMTICTRNDKHFSLFIPLGVSVATYKR